LQGMDFYSEIKYISSVLFYIKWKFSLTGISGRLN